jgi:hypothetical protein
MLGELTFPEITAGWFLLRWIGSKHLT